MHTHKHTHTVRQQQGALSAPHCFHLAFKSDKLTACWLLASVPPNSGRFTPYSPLAGQKVLETVSGTS